MRTLHLFAGIAGGLFADLILGHQPVCAVEIDPDLCEVLRGLAGAGWFPGLVVHQTHIEARSILGGDVVVGGFDPADWKGRVDSVHAGFPCQDLSVAGKGAGIHGRRSGLYREAIRCIETIRPEWALLENVPSIRSRGRGIVIADLVALGYSWRDGTLAAAHVGACHRRNRWWLLAKRNDVADTVRPGLAEWSSEVVAGEGPCPVLARGGWWDAEPAVGRVANGVPDRGHRIRGLGNAQVPLCAAAAWRLLGGP